MTQQDLQFGAILGALAPVAAQAIGSLLGGMDQQDLQFGAILGALAPVAAQVIGSLINGGMNQ